MICGHYVKTFKEATHALPEGMHISADYPFMLPEIVSRDGRYVTLKADRPSGLGNQFIRLQIIHKKTGREVCILEQSSSFEKMFNRKPKRFTCYPFNADSV